MPTGQFLEAEYERNRTSRERICNQILLPNLKPGITVLDIGCGPGFLAKAVSRHVKLIYACDISKGVMACADVINGASNIRFIYSGESGFAQIPDASLDLAYTFAVGFNTSGESIIRSLFLAYGWKENALRGPLPVPSTIRQWQMGTRKRLGRAHQSVAGKLRLKYAMNFFPRTDEFFRKLAAEAGFSVVEIRPVSELLDEPVGRCLLPAHAGPVENPTCSLNPPASI